MPPICSSSAPAIATCVGQTRPVGLQGFDVELDSQPSPYTGTLPFVVEGSRSILFSLQRSLITGLGGPSTGKKEARFTLDYVRHGKADTFPLKYDFTYTTAGWIYFAAGIFGILIGYTVKAAWVLRKEQGTVTEKKGFRYYFDNLFGKRILDIIVVVFLGSVVMGAYYVFGDVTGFGSLGAWLVGFGVGFGGG